MSSRFLDLIVYLTKSQTCSLGAYGFKASGSQSKCSSHWRPECSRLIWGNKTSGICPKSLPKLFNRALCLRKSSC